MCGSRASVLVRARSLLEALCKMRQWRKLLHARNRLMTFHLLVVGLYLRLLLSPRMGFGRVQVTAPRRRAAVAPTLAARLALSRPRVVPRPALASPPLRRRGSRLHKA